MHVLVPLLWFSFFGSAAGFAGGFAPAAGADAQADPESSVRGMEFPALWANAAASIAITHQTSKKSEGSWKRAQASEKRQKNMVHLKTTKNVRQSFNTFNKKRQKYSERIQRPS